MACSWASSTPTSKSLAGPYLYSEATNRALAVRTVVMIKALRNVYGAGALADELLR